MQQKALGISKNRGQQHSLCDSILLRLEIGCRSFLDLFARFALPHSILERSSLQENRGKEKIRLSSQNGFFSLVLLLTKSSRMGNRDNE